MAWNQVVTDCQMSSHLATIQGKTGIPARPQCHEKATIFPRLGGVLRESVKSYPCNSPMHG